MPSIHDTAEFETLTPDEKWTAINKNLIDNMKNMDWGLHRCNKYAMDELLISEKRYIPALQALYEVCYIDINGPVNMNYENMKSVHEPEFIRDLLAQFPPFDLHYAAFAPGIIDLITDLASKQNLDIEAIEKGFLEVAERWFANVKLPGPPLTQPDSVDMPVCPGEAWEKSQEQVSTALLRAPEIIQQKLEDALKVEKYQEIIINYVRQNPGTIQKEIHKQLGLADKDLVRQIIYYLTLNGLICREKKGSSYALFSIKS